MYYTFKHRLIFRAEAQSGLSDERLRGLGSPKPTVIVAMDKLPPGARVEHIPAIKKSRDLVTSTLNGADPNEQVWGKDNLYKFAKISVNELLVKVLGYKYGKVYIIDARTGEKFFVEPEKLELLE